MTTNMGFWEKTLQSLPDSYRFWFVKEREFLQQIITSHSLVLEVGCGDGRSIADILDITQNVVGIDHEDLAVTQAKKNFQEYSSVNILKADAKKLPFESSSFDFVICMTTFANFSSDKYLILNEMKRVLKSKGRIIISVFSENALPERLKLYDSVNAPIIRIDDLGAVTFDESLGDNVSEQFSLERLKEIFEKVGLVVDFHMEVPIAHIVSLKTVDR